MSLCKQLPVSTGHGEPGLCKGRMGLGEHHGSLSRCPQCCNQVLCSNSYICFFSQGFPSVCLEFIVISQASFARFSGGAWRVPGGTVWGSPCMQPPVLAAFPKNMHTGQCSERISLENQGGGCYEMTPGFNVSRPGRGKCCRPSSGQQTPGR